MMRTDYQRLKNVLYAHDVACYDYRRATENSAGGTAETLETCEVLYQTAQRLIIEAIVSGARLSHLKDVVSQYDFHGRLIDPISEAIDAAEYRRQK